MLLATPKAGATVAAQLMFRKYNREDARLSQDGARHRPISCKEVCHGQWTCAKLVRCPLLRAVSAFVYIMRVPPMRDSLPQLKSNPNASFVEFIDAIEYELSSCGKRGRRGCNPHFLPQFDPQSMQSALAQLQALTGLELNSTGLSAPHYLHVTPRRESSFAARGVQDWSVHRVLDTMPPHMAFYSEDDDTLRRRVLALYPFDTKLYEQACQQHWLQRDASSARICAEQLAHYRSATARL